MKKPLLAALVIIIIMCLCVSTAFAGNEGADTLEQVPTEQPEQTEAAPQETVPAAEQPAEPEPTSAPEPTPAPPQSDPVPEDYGTVDLAIYVYNADGSPGAGYSVKIDETTQKTNDEGRATFPDLTVERHNLSITNGDGVTRSVSLYMSRANATKSTGVAQDGTCGLDIARGVSQAYMTVDFVPDKPLSIRLSENKPTPPSVVPATAAAPSGGGIIVPNTSSDTQYQTKEIFATFNDKNGKGLGKLELTVKTDSGQNLTEVTNNSGRAEFENFPYGDSEWSFENEDYSGFALELRKGVQTGVISGSGENLSVSASPRAQRIYLTFVQSGNGFVLEEASESAGGMSVMFLILIIIVIAAGVIITVVVVKKYAGRKPRNIYNDSEDYIDGDNAPRTTGGSNKLNDNAGNAKNGDRNFDDRYRM